MSCPPRTVDENELLCPEPDSSGVDPQKGEHPRLPENIANPRPRRDAERISFSILTAEFFKIGVAPSPGGRPDREIRPGWTGLPPKRRCAASLKLDRSVALFMVLVCREICHSPFSAESPAGRHRLERLQLHLSKEPHKKSGLEVKRSEFQSSGF